MDNWEAMQADLEANRYSLEFAYFHEFILNHASNAIAEKLISEEAFGSHNLRVLLALSMLNNHLALAIQSLWESGFRRWLRQCAAEKNGNDNLAVAIKRSPLETLDTHLQAIRGVRLDDIPGGSVMKEAALVGNVVRHGDGPSAVKLFELAPSLWRNLPTDLSGPAVVECADELSIGDERLQEYADAVSLFWTAIQTKPVNDTSPEPPWVAAAPDSIQS
ncbi:hypothetical protein WBQ88_16895 [Sphingopyxis sp. CCNWLW253]|uniref:hypothetical protein n=1 Tax=unclassified Sphingopyxis TaxID=2614943 RepID=UPI003012A87A